MSLYDMWLMHYGVGKLAGSPGRGSGRYPLGSGDNPNQHGSGDFLSRVDKMKKQGLSETEIARSLDISTTQLRTQLSKAKNERRASQVAMAQRLRDEGYSLNEIARKMGFNNDSSVRSLLNKSSEARMKKAQVTADYLKAIVDEKGMVDVGAGVELELRVSKEKLKEALDILEKEGYPVYGGGIPQVTNPGQQTNVKVLCPPGTEHKEIYIWENVHSVKDYDKILTDDGEAIRKAFEYPASFDSKRLGIRYSEDGGSDKDGVIEIRRGVNDISLGESHYAQVRILVDGTHYLKGMAVYSDDLPPGIDILFNTNKSSNVPVKGPKDNSVLKPIGKDPENPFGALIKERGGQSYYDDPDGIYISPLTGKKQSLSVINKTREEGDWNDWSDHLPSQFLSKQNQKLIDQQLNLSIADKRSEFDDIISLTNPTIKKHMLQSFADDCDSAAVHLQAAALPRQKYQVILPLTSISDKEVYAPNYNDGEKVALIRYPHGGTFEIPILTVNNSHEEGSKVISKNAKDAIGINKKVADRLSGADFDGDTVMVIPISGKSRITSTHALKDLEGFDPKLQYGPHSTDKSYKRMKDTQKQMGVISNLITDMTLKGATEEELARAVKHSMVVIDAEKHNLDYKRSEQDNNIAALKRKYQGHIGEDGKYHEGASTLISRAKSEKSVIKRKGSPHIEDDGSLTYKIVDDPTWVDKKGKVHVRTQRSTQMAETKDAYTLVSSANTPAERAYANYANKLKALANTARKEMEATPNLRYDPGAKKVYQNEVNSLNAKLNLALKNAPRERQAQVAANSIVNAKKKAYYESDMSKQEISKALKKERQLAITATRVRFGAKRNPIEITDKEWKAIQAGAITDNKLRQILNHTDTDALKERATPRSRTTLSTAKQNRIKAMRASGYTNAEIARMLNVSSSTVTKYS